MNKLYAIAGAPIALLTAGTACARLLEDPGGFYLGVGLGELSTEIDDIGQVDDVTRLAAADCRGIFFQDV